jgi:hypothetical protein
MSFPLVSCIEEEKVWAIREVISFQGSFLIYKLSYLGNNSVFPPSPVVTLENEDMRKNRGKKNR